MIGQRGINNFAGISLVFLWLVSNPALPATDIDFPVEQLEDSSPENSCEISIEALDAINEATDVYVNRGNKNFAVWELIKEAEKAGNFPECDSVRAKILAEKAIGMMSSVESNGAGQSDTKTSQKHTSTDSWNCEKLLPSDNGWEPHPMELLQVFVASPTVTTGAAIWAIATSGCFIGEATTNSLNNGREEIGKLQRILYVHETRDKLARDIARGSGEYLVSMAYLHGCPVETHERYTRVSRQNFERIFTDFETDTETLLLNLNALMAKDSLLARECKWIS